MNTKYLTPLVPLKCPVCAADYKGGHEVPGKPMKDKLRIFYVCGCSISVQRSKYNNAFRMLIKNCWCNENLEAQGGVDEIAAPQDFDPMSLNIPLTQEEYYIITNEEDNLLMDIELSEGEATVEYGDSVVPLFSTEAKALEHAIDLMEQEDWEDYVPKVSKITLDDIILTLQPYYSHVIVDPALDGEGGIVPCEDSFLSKISTLEL